jgi:hypothetical protein
MIRQLMPLTLLVAVGICGCDVPRASQTSVPDLASVVSLPPPPPEAWASKPQSEWPQLVLTNSATFNGHSSLEGASSFLVSSPSGETFAATARHLIGPAGGVEPTIHPTRLNGVLQSWKMHPRTMPEAFVEIQGLGLSGLDKEGLDWLILSLKESPSPLPCVPLKLRPKPVEIGETVYLIGCPYVEEACEQNIYACNVTERGYGDRFRYTVEPPVDIRGFSGAPIIDRSGLVVGVMMVWFEPKMSGDLFLEGGGEDVAVVVAAMNDSRK